MSDRVSPYILLPLPWSAKFNDDSMYVCLRVISYEVIDISVVSGLQKTFESAASWIEQRCLPRLTLGQALRCSKHLADQDLEPQRPVLNAEVAKCGAMLRLMAHHARTVGWTTLLAL